eukprot:CAMPEP_0184869944 /NCGR_PEP_ID=MMETSP0580-20130426/35903_1 /TAXON_ID=1118495 /ORGANISM="Dactyliosolen fragilissimus" /LENGTH=386 /DNA_ID=CAMNT_0027371779 /DNA_START=39 /DNA_END=1199 /DNA_ORIENTATION=+
MSLNVSEFENGAIRTISSAGILVQRSRQSVDGIHSMKKTSNPIESRSYVSSTSSKNKNLPPVEIDEYQHSSIEPSSSSKPLELSHTQISSRKVHRSLSNSSLSTLSDEVELSPPQTNEVKNDNFTRLAQRATQVKVTPEQSRKKTLLSEEQRRACMMKLFKIANEHRIKSDSDTHLDTVTPDYSHVNIPDSSSVDSSENRFESCTQFLSPQNVLNQLNNRNRNLDQNKGETNTSSKHRFKKWKESILNFINCTNNVNLDVYYENAADLKKDLCFCADIPANEVNTIDDDPTNNEIFRKYMAKKKRENQRLKVSNENLSEDEEDGTYLGHVLTVAHQESNGVGQSNMEQTSHNVDKEQFHEVSDSDSSSLDDIMGKLRHDNNSVEGI